MDGTAIGEKQGTGLHIFSLNLFRSLAKIDKDNHYTVYNVRPDGDQPSIEYRNFEIKEPPDIFNTRYFWYYWTFWYYSGFMLQIARDMPDVFFSPLAVLPLVTPCPKVVVIHDLTLMVVKRALPKSLETRMYAELAMAVKRADKIIAISQSTKHDLVNLLKVNPKKISVVYQGYDDNTYQVIADLNKVEACRKKYKIHGSYIFNVGSLNAKKNVPRLIEAFALLKKERGIHHKLVIAGKRNWGDDDVFRTLKLLGVEDEVLFPGYVPQVDLPMLMTGADVFVFPSLHEGFGIPLLEAMACGTPVITSNLTSMPEVVGDAGIKINPYSVNEIAEAIYTVISDNDIRNRMVKQGLERVKAFSWERTAREILKILNNTCDTRTRK
jgi:glycosyltransferase involved in cell wall biosynthesis